MVNKFIRIHFLWKHIDEQSIVQNHFAQSEAIFETSASKSFQTAPRPPREIRLARLPSYLDIALWRSCLPKIYCDGLEHPLVISNFNIKN